MVFTDFNFLFFFLPIVLFVHERLRSVAARCNFLIVASLCFYGAWNPWLLILLLGSIVFNYFAGWHVHRTHRKLDFAVMIIINLLPLLYFKYSGMVAHTFNVPVVTGLFGEKLGALLPLGISFFTFQKIAYLADIYQRKTSPHSFRDFALFVTFFPQLIAGPIVHHKQFTDQIGQVIDKAAYARAGIVYFTIGFCKKFFLADWIAAGINPYYDQAITMDFITSSLAAVGYALQLYFDFSGYSDMALGLGLLFGFKLPINFNSPYKATSITDFWRRWHITLSNFLRDYVYIPLGGNRKGTERTYANLLITMLIGGLWHGASWTFVLWGGLHGALLAMERLVNIRIPSVLKVALTFTVVSLLWVLFRAENFETASRVYGGFLNSPQSWQFDNTWKLVFLGLAVLFGPNSHAIVASAGRLSLPPINLKTASARIMAFLVIGHAIFAVAGHAFYVKRVDQTIYREAGLVMRLGSIDRKTGDFRSNIQRHPFFMSPYQAKIAIVGSSFATSMGDFEIETAEGSLYSYSMGMGGNGFLNALRTADYILTYGQNVKAIAVAVSPLNFGNRLGAGPFEGECVETYDDVMPGRLGHKPFGQCRAVSGTLVNHALFFTSLPIWEERFFQFHNFVRAVFSRHDISDTLIKKADLASTASYQANFDDWTKNPQGVANPRNGVDAKFRWKDRGIEKDLNLNSNLSQALKLLIGKAKKKGVLIVFYETTTVLSSEDGYYPSGFYDDYLSQMTAFMQGIGAVYTTAYAHALPWDGRAMHDFIHPMPRAREYIHLRLLDELVLPALEKR